MVVRWRLVSRAMQAVEATDHAFGQDVDDQDQRTAEHRRREHLFTFDEVLGVPAQEDQEERPDRGTR